MKYTIGAIVVMALAASLLAGCSEQSSEEKIKSQTAKVYGLNADERAMAQTNAKQFYEKEWPISQEEKARGFFIECRPSDSNFNGMVSCFGKIPKLNGGFDDVKRYCGYKPELVGCSDEDTVK